MSNASDITMQAEIRAQLPDVDSVVVEYAAGYLNHAARQFNAESDPLADAAAVITQLLLSASGDNTVRQWNAETGAELRKLVGHSHAVVSATYSLDRGRIFSGSQDGTIRIWNSDPTKRNYVEEIEQELSSLPLVDGWIKSATGELLLWVPPEYRNGIRDMCEVCFPADAPNGPVRLDWSKLAKGEEWTCVLRSDS